MQVLQCGNCRYWHIDSAGYGCCRRHAPQMTFRGPTCGAAWPRVRPDDMCGDFDGMAMTSADKENDGPTAD